MVPATICSPSIAGDDQSTESKKKIVKAAVKLFETLKQSLRTAKGKKPSKVEACSELQLPEEIMHHIQSFMSDRSCARTTLLLSKSWYAAWSTRPTLNLYQYNFPCYIGGREDGFTDFAKKTMQRYEDLNLRIHTFWLRMDYKYSISKELIAKALELGAIHLRIEICSFKMWFGIVDEVLESESLASLYVNGLFTLNLSRNNVTYSRLKTLTLRNVTLNGDIFMDLISRCPVIEELGLHYLDRPKNEDLRICSPSLERMSISIRSPSILKAELDVPNIRKFEFEGTPFSRLDFKTTRWEWESDICIKDSVNWPRVEWFSSLNQFVKNLSRSGSRVSLSMCVSISRWERLSYEANRYVGDGLPIPIVEKLELRRSYDEVTPAFLDSLFWSCRPKFVRIQKRRTFNGRVNVKLFQQLCKKKRMKSFQQLRIHPWKTLLNAAASSSKEDFVAFKPNWGTELYTAK